MTYTVIGLEVAMPQERPAHVVSEAVEEHGQARDDELQSQIEHLQAEFASWPKTGLKADKAFFDSLSGDEDEIGQTPVS